jgi:hypothetical protein
MIRLLIEWLEVLGGARVSAKDSPLRHVVRGVWWVVLFAVIFTTIGRATKFIYVDF